MDIFVSDYFITGKLLFDGIRPIVGAEVAKDALYNNILLRGTFDEYHFFVPAGYNTPENLPEGKRVFFHANSRLPQFLKETRDFVFFTPTAGIAQACRLRSLFTKRPFTVCGISADLSRRQQLQEEIFPFLLCDTFTFDSVIYHSASAGKALKKMLTFLQEGFIQHRVSGLRYKGRLDYIPLAIEAKNYSTGDKDVAQKKLGFITKDTHILYLGRFASFNKADLYPLLIVFKELLRKHKHIKLVLAGQNPAFHKYCEKIKKIVAQIGIIRYMRFYCNISEELKFDLYAASDIFVSPADSLQETFGLTVLEAMAAGLPVVVSDWDGYRDLVLHNCTGLLVPTLWGKCDTEVGQGTYIYPGDIQSEYLGLSQSVCVDIKKMKQCLEILIVHKGLRRKFGFSGRRRVLENFDWPVVFPRYERLWKELIVEACSCRNKRLRPPLLYPQYFKAYQGYATRVLDKKSRVKITADGRLFLKTKGIPAGYPGLRFFQPRLVYLILLFTVGLSSVNMVSIYRSMQKTLPELSEESVTFHALWMLKYHLLELS